MAASGLRRPRPSNGEKNARGVAGSRREARNPLGPAGDGIGPQARFGYLSDLFVPNNIQPLLLKFGEAVLGV